MYSPSCQEHPMSSNPDEIVAQMQQDFHHLIDYVRSTQTHTASQVERTLFKRLLALGLQLLRLFFLSRAALRPAAPTTPTGTSLPFHDRRPIDYVSVFGKLSFARHYFYASDVGGCCPLDAELSLPARCYSDLVRDFLAYDATDGAYRESSATIERILGLELSIQSLERIVTDDACDVVAFYDQLPATAPPTPLGSILVAQADGKGVPMVQPSATSRAVRLGKGQKRTRKKEAIVTALYTIAPYVRTPQDVLSALLHEERTADQQPRPRPVQKELRATLDGKTTAVRRLALRAALRDGQQIQERVALSDGAEALQAQLQAQLPSYTLVLDIIHVTDYLWESATALLGETSAERTAWVRRHLERILSGQTAGVIAALEQEAQAHERTATQRAALRKTIGYYQRNLAYMQYDVYLARGWPIGTGVVEGACGHVVKDRMEQAGMRWTKAGAQAMLDLRAVRLTGDWEAYWAFHRQKEHQRLYGNGQAIPTQTETHVLQLAA
jgi:hypothetical protein